jgi:hypothetical protein
MSYALSLTINKYSNFFESINHFLTFDTLVDLKKELINILTNQYKNYNIDYPSELFKFENIIFNDNYIKADAFVYKIFFDNKWLEDPWDTQDIYNDVLESILNIDINNPPDFSEIYGEPNPDENIINNNNIEDEEINDIEKRLNNIMEETKRMEEEQIKECPCEKCLEGSKIQQKINL